jgi:hypothetical protein
VARSVAVIRVPERLAWRREFSVHERVMFDQFGRFCLPGPAGFAAKASTVVSRY